MVTGSFCFRTRKSVVDALASVAGNYGMPEGCTYQIGPKGNTFYRRELRSEAIS